jgi:hypothetical protein
VTRELIEHAARVLQCSPTRSMAADVLYERIRTETGLDVGVSSFMDAIRAQAERFTVLPPLALGDGPVWRERERTAYERALAAAGMAAPTIMLAERLKQQGPETATRERHATTPRDAPPGRDVRSAVLGEAHGTLAELLRAAEDDELRSALASALAELEAARRALERGS